jgi:hypothetical protein
LRNLRGRAYGEVGKHAGKQRVYHLQVQG